MDMFPFIHPSNRAIFGRIMSSVDPLGREAISSMQSNILGVIGRFPIENGCWLDFKGILSALPGKKPTLKTFRRHIEYLLKIGCISQTAKDNKIIRRLCSPKDKTVISLRDFRISMRLSEYNYVKAKIENASVVQSEEVDLTTSFFDTPEAKFAQHSDKCVRQNLPFCRAKFAAGEGQNLPHYTTNYITTDNCNEDQNEDTPYSPPSPELHEAVGRDILQENVEGKVSMDQSKDIQQDEPLLKKVRKKTHQTQDERKQEAQLLYHQGHITPPLGKPNTKGRRLIPDKARPIGAEGNVTIAQLWSAYLKIFEGAFGDRVVLEGQLAGTRENISRHFDEMRQRFLEAAGYVASNRDLYDYLLWFHEPARLKGLMQASRYTGKVGFVHPNQTLGKVHIRQFYDQKLLHKTTNVVVSKNVVKYRHLSEFIRGAFDDIRESIKSESNRRLVYCLLNYGYNIFGEYLRDFEHLEHSEAKKFIISMMASFIRDSEDKKKSVEYLGKIWESTAENSMVESTLWPDWQSACKDFVKIAEDMSAKPMEN